MYESFYGFSQKPFSLLPDPSFLYLGGKYDLALSSMEYGILARAGFVLLTGEPGTGKTTLIRRILSEDVPDGLVGMITNTNSTFETLLPWIMLAYGLSARGKDATEQYQELMEFFFKEQRKCNRMILVIDEAQNLTSSMLEELRLLSNVNVNDIQLIQIILSGQPSLRALVRQPEHVQFAQRVVVDCTLFPLDGPSTVSYIRHRMDRAGGAGGMITDKACLLVHRLTGGIPRLINQICESALVYGFAQQYLRITDSVIANVVKERTEGGILPLSPNVDLAGLLSLVVEDEVPVRSLPAMKSHGDIPHVDGHTNGKGKISGEEVFQVSSRETVEEPFFQESSESDEKGEPLPIRLLPTNAKPSMFLDQGRLLRKKRKYKQAIGLLQKVSQESGYEVRALYEAALCYREAGRSDEAEAMFRKAFDVAPPTPDERLMIQFELGKTLQAMGRKQEALEYFVQIFAINSEFADVADRIKRLSATEGQEKLSRSHAVPNRPSFLARLRRRIGRRGGQHE